MNKQRSEPWALILTLIMVHLEFHQVLSQLAIAGSHLGVQGHQIIMKPEICRIVRASSSIDFLKFVGLRF